MSSPDTDSECTGVNEDDRIDFLLNMYNQLWNSIQRVEQGMWSFITSQAAALASIAGGAAGFVPVFYASLFAAFISFWGMNISVISGRWFWSNIAQVENIELKFFGQSGEEWGKIIPEDYKDHPAAVFTFFPISHSAINFLAFLTTLLVTIIVAFSNIGAEMSSTEESILLLSISGGIGFTILNYRWSLRYVRNFKSGTKENYSPSRSVLLGDSETLLRTVLTIAIPIGIFVGSAQILSGSGQLIANWISSTPWGVLGGFVALCFCIIDILK